MPRLGREVEIPEDLAAELWEKVNTDPHTPGMVARGVNRLRLREDPNAKETDHKAIKGMLGPRKEHQTGERERRTSEEFLGHVLKVLGIPYDEIYPRVKVVTTTRHKFSPEERRAADLIRRIAATHVKGEVEAALSVLETMLASAERKARDADDSNEPDMRHL